MVNSRTTGEMVDGKKHGNWITYYPSGMKRNEGNYAHGKKDGLWIHYHKNGNVESKASFRDGKYEGECITYHPNGNLRSCGVYPEHIGKSYDGKKEGAWYNYEEDGETVWLIVTYKKGGSRAKPDEYPLGVCHVCGEGRRLSWDGSCPKCGEEVEKIPNVSESRDVKGGAKIMTNEEIAQKLLELHTILLVADYPEDHATRYPRLAYTISRMEESVAELVAEGRLQDEIPGVGDIVSTIITEYVQTGTCSKLEEYAADVPETIVELIPVPGLGAKTIKRFYQELGIDSLASLKQAIDENRFKGFRGVGKKTLENLKAYIDENME